MDDVISQIKSRIDIVDFIGSYVTLKRVGRNFRALCPFHQEKTPSFIVSPERQIWRCFGACQEGGDVIKFYMKWENLTFFEAVKELAQKIGIEIKGKLKTGDVKWQQKSRLLAVNTAAAKFYSFALFETNFGKKGLEYLKKRGIDKKIAEKFGLGYAPRSKNSLVSFLIKRGFSKSELIKAGVAVSKGSEVEDRFRGRLIFPLRDYRGQVVGFAGRIIEESDEPKYINIPETLLYKKRQTVFGLDLAKEEIQKKGEVFIVEGEFDMITPYSLGIKNIVAIKGSAITREQLLLLKRFARKIVFLLDNDEAGREAVYRGFENAKGLDVELYVAVLDFAKDPDEAARTDLARFKKVLKSSQVIYDYFIEQEASQVNLSNPYERKNFLEKMARVLNSIENPVIKDFYVKKIAEKAGVDQKVVLEVIRRVKRKRKSFVAKEEEKKKLDPEKFLFGTILQSKEPAKLFEKVDEVLERGDFSTPALQDVFEELKKFLAKKAFDFEKFSKSLPAPLQDLLNELYLYPSFIGEAKEEEIEKLSYFIKIKAVKRAIREAVEKDDANLSKLTEQLKHLEKKYLSL